MALDNGSVPDSKKARALNGRCLDKGVGHSVAEEMLEGRVVRVRGTQVLPQLTAQEVQDRAKASPPSTVWIWMPWWGALTFACGIWVLAFALLISGQVEHPALGPTGGLITNILLHFPYLTILVFFGLGRIERFLQRRQQPGLHEY